MIRRLVFVLIVFAGISSLNAQQIPSRPLSIPVYHPMVVNPAYVGSKDFTNISLTSRIFKTPNNQILTIHQRITGSDGFFSSLGAGAYLFQEQLEESWNMGLAVGGAYHMPLDKASIHNISAGASLKGFFNFPKSVAESTGDTTGTTFLPNMDLGVYYYGPTAFAGLSVTSLFGAKKADEITEESEAYLPREYHLYGGYKFLLSKKNAIVLEPSLLVSLDDSTLSEPHKHLIPYLKLYLQNFYVGTYMKSVDIFALFFQYQFPRFYTGVFLEFPRVGFLNNDNIIFELSLGVNLGHEGSKFLQYRHW